MFGTAPVHMAAEPEKAVNRLVMANTYAEAVERLGYSQDYEKYTLCQVMDAYFKRYAVGPVVFCNVLDPARHKKENEEKEYAVVEDQAVMKEPGVIPSSLVVKNAAGDADLPGTWTMSRSLTVRETWLSRCCHPAKGPGKRRSRSRLQRGSGSGDGGGHYRGR